MTMMPNISCVMKDTELFGLSSRTMHDDDAEHFVRDERYGPVWSSSRTMHVDDAEHFVRDERYGTVWSFITHDA